VEPAQINNAEIRLILDDDTATNYKRPTDTCPSSCCLHL